MGRIRTNFIKRTAREAVKRYKNKLSTDFYENREFLETVIKFSNDRLRNRVAGYVTTLMNRQSPEL